MVDNKPLSAHEVNQRLMLLRHSVMAIQQRYNDDLFGVLAEIQAMLPKLPDRNHSRYQPGDFEKMVPKPTNKIAKRG
jgi:hypothetical protein